MLPDNMDLDAVTIAEQPRTPCRISGTAASFHCDWKQATQTVTLYIPVREGTVSRNMAVQIKPTRLQVAYKGADQPTLIEAELGGRCDPDESEWRVVVDKGACELVTELRKAQWREWVVPFTDMTSGIEEVDAAPAGATGAPAPARAQLPPAITSYEPPPREKAATASGAGGVAAAQSGGGSSLSKKYAEWDRFDQNEALMRLENEGKPDDPNDAGLRMRSGGGGGAVAIEYTDYKKDKEEVALDEELAEKRQQLQA